MSPSAAVAEQKLRRWLEDFVVGLNLCPFAKPVLRSDALQITICAESDDDAMEHALLQALDLLQRSSEEQLATTLLVFTDSLFDFEEFLNFVGRSEALVEHAGLSGLVQLASFHPRYQFAGEPPQAASHFSNRAPYPMLHLLRENMITRALADYPNPDSIPANNVETLNRIGVANLKAQFPTLFTE